MEKALLSRSPRRTLRSTLPFTLHMLAVAVSKSSQTRQSARLRAPRSVGIVRAQSSITGQARPKWGHGIPSSRISLGRRLPTFYVNEKSGSVTTFIQSHAPRRLAPGLLPQLRMKDVPSVRQLPLAWQTCGVQAQQPSKHALALDAATSPSQVPLQGWRSRC